MNDTNMKYIARTCEYLLALLMANACTKNIETETDRIIPADLPDEIPYETLGSGKLVFNRMGYPDNFYLIDIDNEDVSKLLIDPVAGCVISPDGEMITYSEYMDYLYILISAIRRRYIFTK